MNGQDYIRFTQRLRALNLPYMQIETVGVVDDYPVYRILLSKHSDRPKNILIAAGVHGDEPAGPEAAIHFLERDNAHLLGHFRFLILPCINPYGYVHNQRENKQSIDVNRSFAEDDLAEVVIVKKVLQEGRFDFFIDFHEDSDATGFYLYEGRRDERWIGQEVIRNVGLIGQIDSDSGENDLPISDGVFKLDPAWGDQGIDSYVYHFHSDHVMICETPTSWRLDRRAAAHLTALDTVLEHFLRLLS